MNTGECTRMMWHLSRWESSQAEFRSPSIFLNLFYKLLDEESAPSSPLWGFPRRSHFILSLSGRHGFHGSTSSRPAWGLAFPGQSLPLPSPAPGRCPGRPVAVGVQVVLLQEGGVPGSRWGLCVEEVEAVLEHVLEHRNGLGLLELVTVHHLLGKTKAFLFYRQEWGESLLIWPRSLRFCLKPARGSERDHNPEILPGRSWPAPGSSVERTRNPWGRWGCCWAGWDGIWWKSGGRVSNDNLSKQGF